MSKTGYRLKGNSKLYLIALSDLHIGSESFNEQFFNYALDTIDKIKGPRRILLGGDLLEHASKTVGNSAFHTTMTLDDQIDTAINYFRPYKKDIIFTAMGNHEARASRDIDLDVMRLIAKALHCEHGHQYFDTFNINGEPFTAYIKHGKGSSSLAHLQQGKAIRETACIEADLFLEGHSHRLDFFSYPVRTNEGIKRRYYGFTGAFLNYTGGYPDSMTLPVLPPAFQVITINKDRIVRSVPYFIDQVAPEMFSL